MYLPTTKYYIVRLSIHSKRRVNYIDTAPIIYILYSSIENVIDSKHLDYDIYFQPTFNISHLIHIANLL